MSDTNRVSRIMGAILRLAECAQDGLVVASQRSEMNGWIEPRRTISLLCKGKEATPNTGSIDRTNEDSLDIMQGKEATAYGNRPTLHALGRKWASIAVLRHLLCMFLACLSVNGSVCSGKGALRFAMGKFGTIGPSEKHASPELFDCLTYRSDLLIVRFYNCLFG